MGKPVRGGVEEVRACAQICEHFADHAARALASELIPTEATRSCIVFQPLGVIVGVQPWNWPYHQVFRMAVPALMAGNAVVVKHASNVPPARWPSRICSTAPGLRPTCCACCWWRARRSRR
ncbi:aldehyde dehydrogenase family protein [Aquabacterium sp. A7-Y]|nr:aldehyde dehydrogenase family protein [Aquabacterium sp. A7-Y]